MKSKKTKTLVGEVDPEVLAFTAGKDIELDQRLIEEDCLGTAAHVVMLSRLPIKPKLITSSDAERVIEELLGIIKRARAGTFKISMADQDVHLAVEKALTRKLGELGKKIHTGRSRNDQVALDLRLYAKRVLLEVLLESADLANILLKFSRKHVAIPMVGRTHMQPAMPSSVGVWASAHAESLLDDMVLLMNAYELNDRSPLGSAAGYGVPLPIDRELVADLLGFGGLCHNVLYASNTRGKMEAIILEAMSQVMLTLSRLAQDLIFFTMPEFGYFSLPDSHGTGSSIMPQKRNPDVLELVRAKAARVKADALAVFDLIKSLPAGYQRDLQEAKEPFLGGIDTTRKCLRIMKTMLAKTRVNRAALLKGFTPEVFATDWAIELVSEGVPFRDAYQQVKKNLESLEGRDPHAAIAIKTHVGGTAGLDFDAYDRRVKEARTFAKEESRAFNRAISKLMGLNYPSDVGKPA